jgi:hypothetical protein
MDRLLTGQFAHVEESGRPLILAKIEPQVARKSTQHTQQHDAPLPYPHLLRLVESFPHTPNLATY